MKRTLYAAIHEGDTAPDFATIHWRPWIGCDPAQDETTIGLIVHRHMRDRGGLAHGERLTVSVYTRETMNLPAAVTFHRFTVTKD